MIKLNVNNGRSIEMTQERLDGNINVDVLESNGEVDYYYSISPGDMVMLLNYYWHNNYNGEMIFE